MDRTGSVPHLVAVSVCLAALIAAGCAHQPTSQPTQTVDDWMSQRAAPEIAHWYRQYVVEGPLRIRPRDRSAQSGPSRLAQEIAEELATELRLHGVPAETGSSLALLTMDRACVNDGKPVAELIALVQPIGAGEHARVVIHSEAPDLRSLPSFRHETILPLSPAHLRLHDAEPVSGAPGSTEADAYPADRTDQMLQHLVTALRCDLLRARWRAGVPDLVLEHERPSAWYRSIATRLRDELARLDGVVGAPASGVTVRSIDVRSEPTMTEDVYRVIARAVAGSEATQDAGVIWQQVYYRAPGPPSYPAPVRPVAAPQPAVQALPKPAAGRPQVEQPRPTPAGRAIDLRLIRPAGPDAQCDPAWPWRNGFRIVETGYEWKTGDCFGFEIGQASREDVYMLHIGTNQRLTRVHPASCVMATTTKEGQRLRVPDPHTAFRALQLTPPGNMETFIAVAMPTDVQTNLRHELRHLSSLCDSATNVDSTTSAASDGGRLLLEIESHAAAGQLNMTRLVLQHQERRP